MAVADAAVKASPPPPPPPPRIVVAMLVFLRFVFGPMLALTRVVLFAARGLPYLGFAIAWVLSAASAALVVARRVCREGSAPLVFLEALRGAAAKASICTTLLFLAFIALLLCGMCLAYVIAAVSGSGSEFRKSVFGAITQESTQGLFKLPRAVVVGLIADLSLILLMVAGILVVMMLSPVEGSMSQGEMIGSVIVDVGSFGIHAISCFVIIPALALDVWRDDQLDRKAGLMVADC